MFSVTTTFRQRFIRLKPTAFSSACTLRFFSNSGRNKNKRDETDADKRPSSHAFQQFDIMSVGAGGSAAQRFRGLPSTMLNLGGENWIFDVGEGTLRQLVQKYGHSVMDTTRVFITHMHMDHVMGLAALVAASSCRPNNQNLEPLLIYGPLGLHKFLCEIFSSTETLAHMNVVVYELVYTQEDEDRLWDFNPQAQTQGNNKTSRGYQENTYHGQTKGRGGRKSLWKPRKYFDNWPMTSAQNRYRSIRRELIFSTPTYSDGSTGDSSNSSGSNAGTAGSRAKSDSSSSNNNRSGAGNGAGASAADKVVVGHYWNLFSNSKATITAGLIQHTAPCFGYVIKESDKAGPLDPARITELNIPRTSVLKDLKSGLDVTLPDGRFIRSADLIDPNSRIKGRKLVVLGDTNCPAMLAPIAQDCDLLVHEATLLNKGSSDVVSSRGHSTPHTAADTAKQFRAKRMLLNHISPQFSVGNEIDPSSDIQLQILAGQMLDRPEHVVIARDFTTVSVPLGGYSMNNDEFLLHMPLYNAPLPKHMHKHTGTRR